MHRNPCPLIPFYIPLSLTNEDENCSTSSSLLRSKDSDLKDSQEDFQRELCRISLMKDLEDKKTIQELSSFPSTRFGKARARSSSPARENLRILNRNHFLFPTGSPIAAKGRNLPKFTGIEDEGANVEEEEDEELARMKEMYSNMIEEEEDLGVDEEVPKHRSIVHIQCHNNNLKHKM